MKKNIFSRMGAAAVVLTLVTASLVGGTFAKYVTDTTGTATAAVANWNVKFTKDGEKKEDFTTAFALTGTADSGAILPGDKGSFDIQITGEEADVAYKYNIQIAAKDGAALDGMKFYKTADYSKGTDNVITEAGLEETVAYDGTTKANMNKKVTVYWELPAGDDKADTDMAGKTGTYEIKMHAEQVTATP